MLDQSHISQSDYKRIFTSNVSMEDRYELASPFWNRAANQGNVDARVKMGDYYYKSFLGKDYSNSSNRFERAASYYKQAADREYSAIAM